MNRKTYNQNKKDNTNWGEKLQVESSERKTFNVTGRSLIYPGVVMFRDDLMIVNNKLTAYCSSVLSK